MATNHPLTYVIDDPDFDAAYDAAVAGQKDLRKHFDAALVGVNKDDGDAVFAALFAAFAPKDK